MLNLPSTLSLISPAKINLFLHITSKRPDGYHNLQTVFRLLDWGDTLHFNKTTQTFNPESKITKSNLPITLKCDSSLTNDLMDNLIVKAAIALVNWVKNHPEYYLKVANKLKDDPSIATNKILMSNTVSNEWPQISVKLNKVLPTGAGLGGGSSNAATTLKALNQMWGLNLDQKTLITIGASVGADVPIFLFNHDAIAQGIGEQLTAIELPKQTYLLLNPSAHTSTQKLFAHKALKRNCQTLSVKQIIDQQHSYLTQLKAPFLNVFEPIVTTLAPEVKTALNYLQTLESVTNSSARMTGTGSSVFIPIPNKQLNYVTDYMHNINKPPCHAIIVRSI